MASTRRKRGPLTVTAYQGDAKTLLAFDLAKSATKNLAGFTICVQPDGQKAYYLYNQLRFKTPEHHAQDPEEPASSSVNAPLHIFRWVHIPGMAHQGTKPFLGRYKYTVTPRYFDGHGAMLPIDTSLGCTVETDVVPFEKGKLALGFARGFTQSQAFVNHYGKKARIRPAGRELLFDTEQESGVNDDGEHYTYADQYAWLGFTARERIFELLHEVASRKTLRLDMFAYDLNEPDLLKIVLQLAREGRVRVILDNAGLHHSKTKPKPEDEVETAFADAARGAAALKRGKFGRYAHDKVLIVAGKTGPLRVLTGSTNFSVTGLYVNSNHVIVYRDTRVAGIYAQAFEEAWNDDVKLAAFRDSAFSDAVHTFDGTVPKTEITFSPHQEVRAGEILDAVAARIGKEESKGDKGNVLFAVMQVDNGTSPVWDALRKLHANESIFSFGISDTTSGIALYKPGRKTGLLVTGKPASTVLPSPFSQVPGVGLGHQVHHKFVVCGFNRADAVVYCGSSNLALGGEELNGDNLIAIHDRDVATAFAIEAVTLVDHFNFLDRYSTKGKTTKPAAAPADAAANAGWFLSTTDAWARRYYDPDDLKCADRVLFSG
ncbi:MAG TPA: phospholipase D-like domain-containing protein [Gemmatimonadaceae bacterium]|nr:phospholipase D-like domain-containing protein [Gemmatimonadaceae bacterium]